MQIITGGASFSGEVQIFLRGVRTPLDPAMTLHTVSGNFDFKGFNLQIP